MNVVVGDNTGLLKSVSLKSNGLIKKVGVQDRERGGINAMCWAGLHNPESEVAVGLGNGTIEVWNMGTQEMTASMEGLTLTSKQDKIVGVQILRSNNSDITNVNDEITRRVVTAISSGTARIMPWLPTMVEPTFIEDDSLTTTQLKQLQRKKDKEYAALLREREEEIAAGSVEWTIGQSIDRIRLSPSQQIMASGGKENKLTLWNLETQQHVFRARNLPHDWLNMSVPNWDMDFCYLNEGCREPWSDDVSTPYKMAVTTGHRRARIYDIKANTRPVMDVEIGKDAARTIACTNDGVYVIVGDASGRIQKLDTRLNLRCIGVMRGTAGSIREIQVHPTLPMVASVGLDRHLRVHDLDTRKLLKEVYLTQKLTGCLFSAIEPSKHKARSSVSVLDSAEERAAEETWNKLSKLTKGDSSSSKKAIEINNKYEAQEEDEDEDGFDEVDEDDEFDEDQEVGEMEIEYENQKPKDRIKQTIKVSKMADSEDDSQDDVEDDEDMEGFDFGDEDDEDMMDFDDEDFDFDEDEEDVEVPMTFSFSILGAPTPSKPAVQAISAPKHVETKKNKTPPTVAAPVSKKARK